MTQNLDNVEKKKPSRRKREMPTNSLGFATSITLAEMGGKSQAKSSRHLPEPTVLSENASKLCGLKREALICFAFTTALIVLAIGVGVWFAIDEM